MERVKSIINQKGLIRVEHGKHGSRAFLWLEPEMKRYLGYEGTYAKAIEVTVRPFCCVICNQQCAMQSLSFGDEKKDMGAEWLMHKQTHTEISGVLICENCRPGLPKVRIDSYKVSGNFGERCGCTWDGTVLWSCMVCKAKERTLMSSRSVWETLRVLKPLGLFQEGIMTRFSRHPYIGMREHEREAFLGARMPMVPKNGKGTRNKTLLGKEDFAREIKRQDREKDLSFTDIESMRWELSLWTQPILRCFPVVDPKQGSRGKIAWIYVKIGDQWQVRSWGHLAVELVQGSGWLNSPPYEKDFRATQPRSNVTKEKRKSTRKEKFVQLTVSLVKDLDKHKIWCPEDETYKFVSYYDNEQITEVPSETFTVVMHFKLNVLSCSHPDYDWIGGLEVELHDKHPEIKVIKKGIFRRTRRLITGPQN